MATKENTYNSLPKIDAEMLKDYKNYSGPIVQVENPRVFSTPEGEYQIHFHAKLFSYILHMLGIPDKVIAHYKISICGSRLPTDLASTAAAEVDVADQSLFLYPLEYGKILRSVQKQIQDESLTKPFPLKTTPRMLEYLQGKIHKKDGSILEVPKERRQAFVLRLFLQALQKEQIDTPLHEARHIQQYEEMPEEFVMEIKDLVQKAINAREKEDFIEKYGVHPYQVWVLTSCLIAIINMGHIHLSGREATLLDIVALLSFTTGALLGNYQSLNQKTAYQVVTESPMEQDARNFAEEATKLLSQLDEKLYTVSSQDPKIQKLLTTPWHVMKKL